MSLHGEMAEWTMARDSKSRIPLRVSGVQIPLSPFEQSDGFGCSARQVAFGQGKGAACGLAEHLPLSPFLNDTDGFGCSARQVPPDAEQRADGTCCFAGQIPLSPYLNMVGLGRFAAHASAAEIKQTTLGPSCLTFSAR